MIDVPAGTRLVSERRWLQGGIVTVSFLDVATGSWQLVDIDRAEGVGPRTGPQRRQ